MHYASNFLIVQTVQSSPVCFRGKVQVTKRRLSCWGGREGRGGRRGGRREAGVGAGAGEGGQGEGEGGQGVGGIVLAILATQSCQESREQELKKQAHIRQVTAAQ